MFGVFTNGNLSFNVIPFSISLSLFFLANVDNVRLVSSLTVMEIGGVEMVHCRKWGERNKFRRGMDARIRAGRSASEKDRAERWGPRNFVNVKGNGCLVGY
jgi:hypothetical protein